MAQNCRQCKEQCTNLKPAIEKPHSFQVEPVEEPNEEVQIYFAEPLPDELHKDAYILVAVDKSTKFLRAKVISITTADKARKFMQRCI